MTNCGRAHSCVQYVLMFICILNFVQTTIKCSNDIIILLYICVHTNCIHVAYVHVAYMLHTYMLHTCCIRTCCIHVAYMLNTYLCKLVRCMLASGLSCAFSARRCCYSFCCSPETSVMLSCTLTTCLLFATV